MAHNEVEVNANLYFGLDWNASDKGTSYSIAPTVWRWDRYNTSNSGGSFDETLNPDANNGMAAKTWYDIGFGSGSDWRQVDSFATRTYAKGTSARTVTLSFYGYNLGTYWSGSGFQSCGNFSTSWSITVPALASYAVSYNGNGDSANPASNVPANQTKYQGNTLKLSTTVPTRPNHTFKNWNTYANGLGITYSAGGNYTSDAALTLYAQWTPDTYAVTYNANGGSGAPAAQTKTYGVSLTLSSTTPTRAGHTFLGWATSSTATTAAYQAGGSYTANQAVTLYAVWRVDATLTSLTAIRSDSAGTADNEGTYGAITCVWENPTNNSDITVSGTITPQGGSATSLTFATASSGTTRTSTVLKSGVDTDKNYTVTVTLKLSGTTVATKSVTLTKSAFVLDFKEGGEALGIGTAAPSAGLEVGWDAVFDGSVSMPVPDLPNQSRYYVLAAPTASGGGKPTFRRLVAADVGSGTFAIARGGTGASTAANALKNIMGGKSILYNNATGTNGTVTLSDSAANYNHMRIFFKETDDSPNVYSSVDVFDPNGKLVQLSVMTTTAANGWLIGRTVSISGTSITTNSTWYGIGAVNDSNAWGNTNKISIVRVEAWNE